MLKSVDFFSCCDDENERRGGESKGQTGGENAGQAGSQTGGEEGTVSIKL